MSTINNDNRFAIEAKNSDCPPKKLTALDPGKVLEVFNKNRLLARAIETETLGNSSKPDISNWDEEFKLLQSEKGRRNTCCTLMIPGAPVGTYKPFGMLFDARTADVFRAASHDINSWVDNTGEMSMDTKKGTLENMELSELEKFIKSTPNLERETMNEVNAHFKAEDLLGLFVNKMDSQSSIASLLELQILFIQKHLKIVYGFAIPLFVYDSTKGVLNHFDDSIARIQNLLVRTRALLEPESLKYVANMLGFDVLGKGRIVPLKSERMEIDEKENNSLRPNIDSIRLE